MTATIGEIAELRWGYTMADIDDLARRACGRNWYSSMDPSDRREAAWFGIIERLYVSLEAPSRDDLYAAGSDAIREAGNQHRQAHGLTATGGYTEAGPAFSKYWRSVIAPSDFTERIVERIALAQVLGCLTPAEYEVVAAIASYDTQTGAADALGISRRVLQRSLATAREKVIRAWLEGETPRALRTYDPELECRAGHDRASHGEKRDGRWKCRLCLRATSRRHRARAAA